MINRKEFEICKRRGHDIGVGLLSARWSQFRACRAWVRVVTTIDEREDRPPENEITLAFKLVIDFGRVKVRGNEEPIDQEELEICKRRSSIQVRRADAGLGAMQRL